MRILRSLVVGILVIGIAAGLAGTTGLWHAHYRAYVVHTGSMMPTYKPGDVVIDRPAPGVYHAGEVITFRHSSGPDVVTHRIASIDAGGLIHTKGDADNAPDAWTIHPRLVQGAVVHVAPYMGYVVVFLKQPTGVPALATAVIALILLWGLFFSPPREDEPAPALRSAFSV